MKFFYKKVPFVYIIFITFMVLFMLFSANYELFLFHWTFFDVIIGIWYAIIIVTCLAVSGFACRRIAHKFLKTSCVTTIVIMSIGVCFVISGIRDTLNGNVNFYDIEVLDDSYERVVVAKEKTFFYKTAGVFYVKINPFLLKKIDASAYGCEAGIYPIGSGAYTAIYNKDSGILYVSSTKDVSDYQFELRFKLP